MARFLRRVAVPSTTLAATRPHTFDLPVNPLSALILRISYTNPDPALIAWRYWASPLEAISRLTIRHNAARIYDAPLADLAVLSTLASHWPPWRRIRAYALNTRTRLTVPLCFGRRPYDPTECLPTAERGKLTLTVEPNFAEVQGGTLGIAVDTVELPDAKPTRYLRAIAQHNTRTSGDRLTFALPSNTTILGALLVDTQPPVGPKVSHAIQNVSLTLDNVETYYSSVFWDVLHGDLLRAAPELLTLAEHIHATNNTSEAAPLSEQQTDPISNLQLLSQYAWLDFDPLGDGQYLLDTRGLADIQVRTEPNETSTDPVRVLPLELINLAGGAQ